MSCFASTGDHASPRDDEGFLTPLLNPQFFRRRRRTTFLMRNCHAFTGLGDFRWCSRSPKALPWASLFEAFGVAMLVDPSAQIAAGISAK